VNILIITHFIILYLNFYEEKANYLEFEVYIYIYIYNIKL